MDELPAMTIRTHNGAVVPPTGYCLSENQKIGLQDKQFIGRKVDQITNHFVYTRDVYIKDATL